MKSDINNLIGSYYSWLKDKTRLKEINDFLEITTPFLDRNNDYLQIYVKKTGDRLLITDDGYTLNDLYLSGCKIDTPKRKDLLNLTLNGFGVKLDNDAITVISDYENFPLNKHNIIQSILAVNDLFFTSQPLVANLFIEDVAKWLDRNSIRFIPNLKFNGKTGYDYSFHFAIPKSSTQPERIIQAISSPSRSSVENFILSWLDTKDKRPEDSKAYAFLNDYETVVKQNIFDALQNYNIKPVLWKEREIVKEELAA